ncbi:hypothetical protein BST61_g3533 [Cercospora zeina]
MQALRDALGEVKAEGVMLGPGYPFQASHWQDGDRLPLLQELKYTLLVLAYRPNHYQKNLGIWARKLFFCLDSALRRDKPDDLYNIIQAQLSEGTMFADALSPQLWPCAQWKFDATERYNETFQNIDTKHPLLMPV